jgi:hypothetical protein
MIDPEVYGPPPVLCVCGMTLIPLDDDREYPEWMHKQVTFSCSQAVPAAGMPTKTDRKQLSDQWSAVGPGLDRAAGELAELRAQLDSVDQTMARMEARLTAPSVVRRATLNQVWDRLVDDGQMTAAAIVMKMIKNVVDE